MIFISYRIADSLDLVDRLDADLIREFGAEHVFRDKSRLHGGQDWPRVLEEQAKNCALNTYRWAWGEGPPYIHWYTLERSKALLRELGEPEPQLPSFDPSKVKPVLYEAEIRAAIARLRANKEARSSGEGK